MKKFWNLYCDELNRDKYLFIALFVSAFLLEIFNIYGQFAYYKNYEIIGTEKITLAMFFDYSPFHLFVVWGVMIFIVIYCYFTWLREWYFKGQFIYRLLMLPGSRFAIGLAKLAVIVTLVFAMYGCQIMAFSLTDLIAKNVLGTRYLSIPWYTLLAQGNLFFTSSIMPLRLTQLLLSFTLGISWVLVAFNASIFFASSQHRGFAKSTFIAAAYILISFVGFSLVNMGLYYLITTALSTWLVNAFAVVFCIANLGLLYYLLNNKVRV